MAYQDIILAESSLVSYWRLGESSGTLADDAKSTNDGTYVATPTLGAAGALYGNADTAVTLNGSNQYVTVPDNNTLDLGDGPLSIELWCKFGVFNSATSQKLIDKGSSAYGLRYSGSGKRIALTSGSTVIANFQPGTISDTLWHHLVATKNGASVVLWMDGRIVTGTVTNSTLVNTSSPLRIGATQTPSEFFNGTLDEVAVYNSVLGADSVLAHYNAGKTPFDTRMGRRKKFRGGQRPGSSWRPGGPASPFNKPIAASPALHSNSAAIITKVTGWGAPGNMVIGDTVTDDSGHPIYYAKGTDPLYTITQGTSPNSSDYYGTQVRIPQAAKPAQGNDRHLCSVQPDGTCWDFYDVTESPMTPGGGNITVRGAQKTSVHGDLRRTGTGNATAAGVSLLAGIIRYEELMAGVIPHRLFMTVKSTDGTQVYPSQGIAGQTDPTNAPPDGALFQLNMTDAAIDALSTTWYNKVVFKAMAHYGLHVADTTGAGSWGIQLESAQGYAALGLPDPWREFARRNDGDGVITWSPTSDTFAWNFNVPNWASNLRVLDPSEA